MKELQSKRDEVRRQKASKASSVDALTASDAEVRRALAALASSVSVQRDRVEETERAISQAVADQDAAEAAQRVKQAELEAVTSQLRGSAVESYISAVGGGTFAGIGAVDVNDTVQKRAILGMRVNRSIDLAERFRSVQEDLEAQRSIAESAAASARENKVVVEARLDELGSAVQKQQAFAAQVENRLDAALAEADALASLDAELASSINAKQVEVAKAIEAQRAEQAARTARSAASRASKVITRPPPSRSSAPAARDSGTPSQPALQPSPRGGGGAAPPIVSGGGEIVSVGGIRVHSSIAGNLQGLLAAASSSGIALSGGGFRDPAGQIAVRRNNCGSSNYAIYEMPSSSCRPPTARPGSSMHERGLAVDFTQGGRTLTRGSSAFAWLKSNAASYGFKNLPSEPWHWSTNGN